jgi:hypothetical protein
MPLTLFPVARQRLDRAGMDRQLPGLGELGLPYRQHSALEIDIRIAQVNGFGNAQPGRGHQAEQGFVGERPKAAGGAECACRREQVDDLVLTVDVGCHAAGFRAEERRLGNLGVRLELLQVADEVPQPSPTARPGARIAMAILAGTYPFDHQFRRQRTPMALGFHEAGKAGEEGVTGAQVETLAATLSQIVVDSGLQALAPAHDSLPGQGNGNVGEIWRVELGVDPGGFQRTVPEDIGNFLE